MQVSQGCVRLFASECKFLRERNSFASECKFLMERNIVASDAVSLGNAIVLRGECKFCKWNVILVASVMQVSQGTQ